MDGEIPPAELETALDDGEDPLVVDIRNPRTFEREHIPGSVNIPLQRLPQEIERVSDADRVVTVCPHGKASVKAARLITSFEDFDGRVESLESGLTGWEGPLAGEMGESGVSTQSGETPDAPF